MKAQAVLGNAQSGLCLVSKATDVPLINPLLDL